MTHYDNPFSHEICSCGEGQRLVSCFDCFQYLPSCARCFVTKHFNTPFHWARVWNLEGGFWSKYDYSALSDDCAIQLGHHGALDTCPSSNSSMLFTIVHTNGIHGTRLRFCHCQDAPDKVTQLIRARLFPGTALEPKTAYTFSVLKEFHIHNLQSKCGAFDYIASLKRMTDNVFTSKVQVCNIVKYIPTKCSSYI
jgi:hypothetical protein